MAAQFRIRNRSSSDCFVYNTRLTGTPAFPTITHRSCSFKNLDGHGCSPQDERNQWISGSLCIHCSNCFSTSVGAVEPYDRKALMAFSTPSTLRTSGPSWG